MIIETDKTTRTTLTARTYANPVPYVDGASHTAPDPFVIRYRNLYYCYATDEHGILVSTSPDMTSWTSHGYCYTEEGRRNFWAPSVILLNGVFHMYFSNMPEEETDTHTEIMRVAVSDNPLGPFEKKAELFDTFAIDSQVVLGDDGRLYLLYADNQAAGLSDHRPGTSVMVDRLATPFRREGHPRPLIVPTMDEEIFARNRFGDGRDWHTVEGATYFTYRDKAFITYSANAYEHEDYFVGYSSAPLPGEPESVHIDGLAWTKQRNEGHFDPLLIRSSQVGGTGHNSIVKAPNGVDDWIVYHGRNAADELHVGTEQRVMRIDPLYYAEGGLDTCGPTSDRQDAPCAANITSDFADGVPEGWSVIEGSASGSSDRDGAMLCADEHGVFLATDCRHEARATVVASVWAKADHTPLGERFGLIVRYADALNLTKLEVNVGEGVVKLVDVVNGVARVCAFRALADLGLDATTWHEYRVERAYGHCEIRVDGRFVGDGEIADAPGNVGLFSVGTAARFSAFLATDHVNLWGRRLADVSREGDALEQFVADEDGLRPLAVRSASMALRQPLDGVRYVLDMALDDARGRAVIAVSDYLLAVDAQGIELLRDGEPIDGVAQPERLRHIDESPRRDRFGRTLRTVRLAANDGLLSIHVRNHTWLVTLPPDGDHHPHLSFDGACLVGYTRTSLDDVAKEGA